MKNPLLARRSVIQAAGLALLLAGCAAPVATTTNSVTPAAARAPGTGTPPAKPFGLAWESECTQPGELTGIESSTDLLHWQVETQWTMAPDWPASVIVSNTWHDTARAPVKFYRAFNRLP